MADPRLNSIDCPGAEGSHRMAYWEWGDPLADHTVLCVHGLTRQGRDFDVLAQALVARSAKPLRVVCVDVAGRGESDWLADPLGYAISAYAADVLALLAVLKPQTLDWVGTSMGGLIGIAASPYAQSVGATVRRLVLNDVGPALQWDSLMRIGNYLGKNMQFDTVEQAAEYLWSISSGFGPHTPQQWLALSRPMVRPLDTGGVRLHYDPAIAVPIQTLTPEMAQQGEAALWQLYDSITAPTLLVRGAQSDLLSAATAHAMTQRGPRARLVEFEGVGHAPTFVSDAQVEVVCSFLLDEAPTPAP